MAYEQAVAVATPRDKRRPRGAPASSWLGPATGCVPVALFAALSCSALPRFGGGVTTVNLSYSTFISDRQGARGQDGSRWTTDRDPPPRPQATLHKRQRTTPRHPAPFAGTPLEDHADEFRGGVNAAAPSSGLGTEVLYWIILLSRSSWCFWLIRRMSGAAARPARWAASWASAGPGPRCSTPSGRRPILRVARLESAKREITRWRLFKHPDGTPAGAVAPAAC